MFSTNKHQLYSYLSTAAVGQRIKVGQRIAAGIRIAAGQRNAATNKNNDKIKFNFRRNTI